MTGSIDPEHLNLERGVTVVIQIFNCESDKHSIFVMSAQSPPTIIVCIFSIFNIVIDAIIGTIFEAQLPIISDILLIQSVCGCWNISVGGHCHEISR